MTKNFDNTNWTGLG